MAVAWCMGFAPYEASMDAFRFCNNLAWQRNERSARNGVFGVPPVTSLFSCCLLPAVTLQPRAANE